MNNIKFATLHYASRLKYLVAVIIFVWILSYIFSSFGGSSRSTRLVAPFPMSHQQLAYNSTIAKTIEYCNPAHTIKAVDEGKHPVRGSTLEFVAVVIRHGERSPRQQIRHQKNLKCDPAEDSGFKAYLQVFREMVPKFAFHDLPLYPLDKQCSKVGTLTWNGAHQLLTMGQELRKVYIDNHMLPNSLDRVTVTSTNISRAYQSAMAFMYGFLQTPQVADIKVTESESPYFCTSKEHCDCPRLETFELLKKELWKHVYRTNTEADNLIKKIKPIVFKKPDESVMREPLNTFDALMGYVCHSHPLPCEPHEEKCVSRSETISVLTYLEKHLEQVRGIMKNAISFKHTHLYMQGFFVHLLEQIKTMVYKTSEVRFELYSGHEATMDLLLQTLGINDVYIIPFAARISFEVYSFIKGSVKHHAVKVIYNGKDITTKMPFCNEMFDRPHSPFYGACLLQKFESFVSYTIMNMGFSSFELACEAET